MLTVPRVEDFSDRLRGPAVTARVGTALGICFGICFLTGVWSHFQQTTPGWLAIPPSPYWLYRVTQGIHVITGTVAVPLLLVKLWSVYPQFFKRFPLRPSRTMLVNGLDRFYLLVLVTAAIFQLVTGLLNVVHWYPWSFSFRSTHYAVAWIAIGALVLHIAVKLPLIRSALTGPLDDDEPPANADADPEASGISRRTLLRTTWVAAALAFVATAGQAVPWLRSVSVFAVRSGDGPLGVPINRTAAEAGVPPGAGGDAWQLEVGYDGRTTRMSRADLEAMDQVDEELPIACVEGWSASGVWTGVPVAAITAAAGAPPGARVFVTSMQTRGAFATSELPPQFVDDRRTLLALRLNGADLTLDHGYPCRIIAPNRPGVLQTKWVTKLEVSA